MKKLNLLLVTSLIVLVLGACSQQEQGKESNENEVPVEEPVIKEPIEIEEPEGSTEIEEPGETEEENATEQTIYENEVFKDVVVTDSDGQITVTGKARVFEGVFQYRLTDGDQVLLEDHYQTDGAPAWGDFSISFEESLLTQDQAIFELFVYSAKDGAKTDLLEIPME